MSDLDRALDYLRKHVATVRDCFGRYNASTNLTDQVSQYACDGCRAKGESRWPTWEVKFEHESDCGFMALMRVLEQPDNGTDRL